jgi:serine/threonine protein phosphatase PrpC
MAAAIAAETVRATTDGGVVRNADWGVATDTGLHRDHNEDAFLARPALFAVADGMGGHQAGEVASAIAVAVLDRTAVLAEFTAEDVTSAVLLAHDEIAATAAVEIGRAGMGTTITGLAVVTAGGSEHWAVFNVGDSRVYRLADGVLSQVTVDHSEVEELVASGRLDRDQARSDRRRNIITRSLGSDERPLVDMWVFPPSRGEQFLICSDGLTGELPDDRIAELMLAASSAREAAAVLVAAAVEAGGHDNVTVIVVRPDDPADGAVDEDTSPRSFAALADDAEPADLLEPAEPAEPAEPEVGPDGAAGG